MPPEQECRFIQALSGLRADRIPYFFRDLTLSLDEGGYSTPEVCAGNYDSEKASRSVISLQKRLHQDAVVGCVHHVGFDVELLGGVMRYPEYGIPSILVHPFQESNDPQLTSLDVKRDGPYPEVLRSYSMVSDAMRGSATTVVNAEGPLTKAALLRGLENLIMDGYLNPGLTGEIVEYAMDSVKDFATSAVEAGAECMFLASASDNTDIFPLESVLEHTIPGVREIRRAAGEVGVPLVFHPHGDLGAERNIPYLDAILDSEVDGLQFAEENDIGSLMRHVGDRTSLMGGTDVASVLLIGPESRIAEDAIGFMDLFRDRPDYVFMCSCSLHRGLPMANVEALANTLRTHI